jgi:undecaprenyl-diphosphatase
MSFRLSLPLERAARWDGAIAFRLNRASCYVWLRAPFQLASRLGDGIFWYVVMLGLLLGAQADAVPAVVHMIATGLVCTALYKGVKRTTVRPRPFETYPGIVRFDRTLDHYSFPSGHTLHAVAFTLVAVAYYPSLAWLTVPFTCLVAASRVVLGLHYPSDVLAGALLGGLVAGASLCAFP